MLLAKNKTRLFLALTIAVILPALFFLTKVSAEHRKCYVTLQQGQETYIADCNNLPADKFPGGNGPDPDKCYRATGAQLTVTSISETDCSSSNLVDPDHGGQTQTGAQTQLGETARLNSDCNNLDNCQIFGYLRDFTNVLSAVVGIVIVIMFAVRGIQFATAKDNAQQVTQAKEQILWLVIALVVYMFSFAILQWLIPGGLF